MEFVGLTTQGGTNRSPLFSLEPLTDQVALRHEQGLLAYQYHQAMPGLRQYSGRH